MCVADGCVGPESVRIDEIFPVKFLTDVDYDEESENFPPKKENFSELFPVPKSAGVDPGAGGV